MNDLETWLNKPNNTYEKAIYENSSFNMQQSLKTFFLAGRSLQMDISMDMFKETLNHTKKQ